MVSIEKITEYIQNTLNAYLNGLNCNFFANTEFKLFTDTGVFEKDIAEKNIETQYLNGLVTALPSDRYYLSNGFEVATLPIRLEVTFPLENDEENGGLEQIDLESGVITVTQAYIGNTEKIKIVRETLDKAFNDNQIITLQNDNGIEYVVSVVSQIAQGGTRQFAGIIGYNYSFTVNFSFAFVENGLNSRQGKFTLDGNTIPFTSMSIVNVKNVDMNVMSSSKGKAKAFPLFTGFSVTMEVPALLNDENTATFLKELLAQGQTTTAHLLGINLTGEDGETEYFLVSITEVSGAVSGVQNVGLKITFTDCVDNYEFITFDSTFNQYVMLNNVTNNSKEGYYIIFKENGELKSIVYGTPTLNDTETVVTTANLSSYSSVLEIIP